VARRVEVMNGDEAKWPLAARESITRQAKKLEALHTMLTGLQSELDQELHNLAAEQVAKKTLQVMQKADVDTYTQITGWACETLPWCEKGKGIVKRQFVGPKLS